jgi:hypothetical protein
MRNPNIAICRKQDAEDFDASNITPTTRMMSILKVTVQAKLHVTNYNHESILQNNLRLAA